MKNENNTQFRAADLLTIPSPFDFPWARWTANRQLVSHISRFPKGMTGLQGAMDLGE